MSISYRSVQMHRLHITLYVVCKAIVFIQALFMQTCAGGGSGCVWRCVLVEGVAVCGGVCRWREGLCVEVCVGGGVIIGCWWLSDHWVLGG